MPESILLLCLEGPLQSWGMRSRWSRRDTGPEPSKSAIIGMLGCAAGVLRPDWRSGAEPVRTLEQWNDALLFGVRIDRPGIIETDYHTVQGKYWQADGKLKQKKIEVKYNGGKWKFLSELHTEITWRDYLHDAAFLVALTVKPEWRADYPDLLQNLEQHLMKPKWPLYLGRKACVPTRPILYKLTDEYRSMEEAFCDPCSDRVTPRSDRDRQLPILTAWIECPEGEYERQDSMRLNQLRFYDFRRCRRIEIDTQSQPWRIIS